MVKSIHSTTRVASNLIQKINLSDTQLKKLWTTYGLTPGTTAQTTQQFGDDKCTFSNTPLLSSDPTTVARMIGVNYNGQQTRIVLIQKRLANSVDVTIVPVTHPTESQPIKFNCPDPEHGSNPPPPDATTSYGIWGWALSFSEAEIQQIVADLNSPGGVAARAFIAGIIGHFVWYVGLIVALFLALLPPLVTAIDNAGGKKGICFVDTWWQIFWVRPNPVPWGF